MSTKYEAHEVDLGGSGGQAIHLYYKAQTFTPSIAHTITSVKLNLYRIGLPGTMLVSIRAVDGSNKPTGPDLCSGTTDGDTLTTATTGEWREITLGAGTSLSAEVMYAIVCAPTSNGNNPLRYILWRAGATSIYLRGANVNDNVSGTDWSAPSLTADLLFSEWGDPVSAAPTVTTQAVSNITGTTATGNGNITDLGSPNPTAHGVCWNTTGTPTTGDDSTDEGAASATGPFTSSMTGLEPETTYYVRAYATNTVGTSYGSEVSFTTTGKKYITATDPVARVSSIRHILRPGRLIMQVGVDDLGIVEDPIADVIRRRELDTRVLVP